MESESDVSGLQPAAREPMRHVADVLRAQLGDALVTLAAHGSAVKGGYIAGCSDLDLVAYMRPSALTEQGQLALPLVIDLYAALDALDTTPFRYIQAYTHHVGHGPGVGLVPGAYHIVWGEPEVPLADAPSLLRSARESLGCINVEEYTARVSQHLLGWGRDQLHRELRWLCTDVWPALYHLLTLESDDPLAMWRLPKPEAIARTGAETDHGQVIRAFYAALEAHYSGGETLATALGALDAGLTFLATARAWYDAYQRQREFGAD